MSAAAYMVKIPSEPGMATPPSPAEPELAVGAHANFKVPFIFLHDLCVPPKKKVVPFRPVCAFAVAICTAGKNKLALISLIRNCVPSTAAEGFMA